MLSINTTIDNLDSFNPSVLWQIVENYCNIGQKTYRIIELKENLISLKETKPKTKNLYTAIKIISCFTVLLPLFALTLREYYRSYYQFKVIIPPTYNLDVVINQIKEQQKKGLNLGLFVGRRDNQTLPQEKGWVWCSLDNAEITSSLENHLHLNMDFNNENEMQKIQGLFDKVITDYSVLKFLGNSPWFKLKYLLVDKSSAELITESWKGDNGLTTSKIPIYFPSHATLRTPITDGLIFLSSRERSF